MSIAIIIQARLGSTRLPEKVLKKINDKSIIELIYKRLSRSKLINHIIVAIPKTKRDDKLAHFLKKKILSFIEEMSQMFCLDFIRLLKNLI